MRGIEPVSVVDAVCEAFVHDLLSDLYQPGSGFTELDVAERYGVARPTAREAITRLASQGFLVRQPNRTAIYPRLQATDLRELVVVRLALEEASERVPGLDGVRDGIHQQGQRFHAASTARAGGSQLPSVDGHVRWERSFDARI